MLLILHDDENENESRETCTNILYILIWIIDINDDGLYILLGSQL